MKYEKEYSTKSDKYEYVRIGLSPVNCCLESNQRAE